MNQSQAIELHKILVNDEPAAKIEAVNLFFKWAEIDKKVSSKRDAEEALFAIYIELLNRGKDIEAALLLWGIDMFDPRPRSVQKIWSNITRYSRILIPGGSAQGKSFTPAAWAVLWWTHDPQYTSVKIISVTRSHAATNLMATIKMFHSAAVIKLPGRVMQYGIDLDNKDERASVSIIALPVGEDVKARLRGFHPIPRPPHPIFGLKTRSALIADEGEDVGAGMWEGIDNFLSTDAGDGIHAKVISGANPKKRESAFAQRCEFPGGWQNFDIDNSTEWFGPEKFGSWRVVRLDPARSENVVQKEEVFRGMMTYQGWLNYVRLGKNSSDYYTFARGAWPESTAEFIITPQQFFNDSVGTLVFQSDAVPIASLDPAFSEGGDNATMTTGRFGTALGYTTPDQNYVRWDAPRKAIQIEQQFQIPKDNTLIMANYIIQFLKNLHIRPEWFIMDRTGNAHGLYDAIRMQYGTIFGLQWGEGATEGKILTEDSLPASEVYFGVSSEMMFAFARWLEFGSIKFAPMMDMSKIFSQAINRKFGFYRNLMKAEDKMTYKSTAGHSPDEYDSAIMLIHLARVRESQRAQMVPTSMVIQGMNNLEDRTDYGAIDVIDFVPIST